jgi:adenylate cyclase
VSDVAGYSRLAGVDEDRTLARLRTLRSDLVDPIISVHQGRVVKRTGDGSIIEFRSVVHAVRCAVEVQTAMVERNAGVPPEKRIEFRVGIYVGDVVEESDGRDLMGDGVNVAARLESIAKPGAVRLSEDAYRQVKGRLDLKVGDLGPTQLKNIAEPVRDYSLEVGTAAHATVATPTGPAQPAGRASRLRRGSPLALSALAIALVLAAGGAPTDPRPIASTPPAEVAQRAATQ